MLKNIYACLLVFTILTITPFINAFAAQYRIQPGSDLVGEIRIINAHPGDTIADLAQAYDLGINEMVQANKFRHYNAWTRFKGGEVVVVPSRFILPENHTGLVINVSELRIFYFPENQPDTVYTYPIAAGREAWRTPSGNATIIKKKVDPEWNIPESIRKAAMEKEGKELPNVMPSGPDNPLGFRAMYLNITGYLIHGNNSPYSIGTFASSGCIRMYNPDVEELFDLVEIGQKVRIVYFSTLIGYDGINLYMETNNIVKTDEPLSEHNYADPAVEIEKTLARHGLRMGIHAGRYQKSIEQQMGIPVVISLYPNEY